MNILFPALLGFACLMALYRFAIRRVLLDLVRFRIFALRDSLRGMAIEGKVKADSFAYGHLEKTLCNLVSMTPALNMYKFGQFMIWRKHLTISSRETRFSEIAPKELEKIQREAIKSLFWVLFINTPLAGLAVAFTVGIFSFGAAVNSKRKLWLARKRIRLEERGREFLEQDLSNGPVLATA